MHRGLPETSSILHIRSVLGKTIRTTPSYFTRIKTVKHPELRDTITEVLVTFQEAEEVWRAGSDIYLYYRRVEYQWLVAVARHLNGDGFLITAYRTSKKKRKGKNIWRKNM